MKRENYGKTDYQGVEAVLNRRIDLELIYY